MASNHVSPEPSLSGLGIVLDRRSEATAQKPQVASLKRTRASTVAYGEPALRNSMRMNGLLNAETGGTMVRLDPHGQGSGFKEGSIIKFDNRHHESTLKPSKISRERKRSSSLSLLNPHQKLATSDNDSEAFLEATPNLSFSSNSSSQPFELDVILENNTSVEGSSLNGYITIKTSKRKAGLRVGSAKIRVVGFEAVPHDRHTFYQHSAPLEAVSPTFGSIFCSPPNREGFKEIGEGKHQIPFSFHLPRLLGAKGSVISRSRVNVRYIVLVSFRYCDGTETNDKIQKLAHFYRACHIFPSYDPIQILGSAATPLVRASSKSLFLGGDGKMNLDCSIHRATWVAGQQCWVNVRIRNDTTKRVKNITFTLSRNTTTFRILPQLNPGGRSAEVDIDACETSTSRHKLVEVILESGAKGTQGTVTGKGWWCGVGTKEDSSIMYGIPLPLDALTIPRSRLLEISYILRITANTGSLSSDVFVELPVTIINFISLYPPPAPSTGYGFNGPSMSQMKPRLTPDGQDHDPKPRLRATSIPEHPRARGALFSDVHQAHPHNSKPLNDIAPRLPIRSTRLSLPNSHLVVQNHPKAAYDPGRDFAAQIYPIQTQYPSEKDDSDDDDIAEVIHSARLGGDTDDDAYHTEESASVYQSDFMTTNDASDFTATFNAPSRPQPEQQYQDSFRSRRLPSPPIPQITSTSSRLSVAPAGPRPRSHSRSKIPSTFLLAPRPLLHQEEVKREELVAGDDDSDKDDDNEGTPEAQNSALTEVGVDSNDNVNSPIGDYPTIQAQNQAEQRGHNVVLPSGGAAVGLGLAMSGIEIRRGSSQLVQKNFHSTGLEFSATEPPEPHRHTTSRSRESGVSHMLKADVLVDRASVQPSTSRPQMPASTSIKARIAELERAGLNKAG